MPHSTRPHPSVTLAAPMCPLWHCNLKVLCTVNHSLWVAEGSGLSTASVPWLFYCCQHYFD